MKKIYMAESNQATTHIPIKSNASTTNSVRQLKCQHGDGQENADPNYTRDTLPPKVLNPALDVFVEEKTQNFIKQCRNCSILPRQKLRFIRGD